MNKLALALTSSTLFRSLIGRCPRQSESAAFAKEISEHSDGLNEHIYTIVISKHLQCFNVLRISERGEENREYRTGNDHYQGGLLGDFDYSCINGMSHEKIEGINRSDTYGKAESYIPYSRYWKNREELIENCEIDRIFTNEMKNDSVNENLKGWHIAVECAKYYADLQ